LGVAGSDRFDVRGLPVGPLPVVGSGDVAVSLGGVFVVDAGASFVTEPFVSVSAGVADFVSEVVLEEVDPAVPPVSSAHASPLLHPVTMAAPTPKATAKPPTRPTYASPGMRYV
jgi:hypothetical protein